MTAWTRLRVHLDLDDRALEVVGRWPWPRAKWARILDELRLAGPKAVEMDVILSEPQEIVAHHTAHQLHLPLTGGSLRAGSDHLQYTALRRGEERFSR